MGSRKRIVAFVLVMLFFFPFVPTIVSASPDGESWLVGWSYRKSHLISSASGAGTNYQVKIVVHYGSGTDSGFDIFCGGKCKTNFGDIRFTDNDGITLLDYWMEKKTDSDKAVFWVEVADDLSTSDATIYTYYGNPAASTASDGDATFILFDSYDDNSLDTSKWNWQLDNNNASATHLAEQNQRMESWKDAGSGVSAANYRESDDSWPLERIVEFELYVDYDRTSIGGHAHQWQVWIQDNDNKLSCTHGSYNSTHFRIILEKVEGGLHTPGEWAHFSWDTWYYVRTRIDSTSIVLEVFSGGFDETIEHVQYLSHTRTGYGRFHNRICSGSSATDGFGYFDDDFRVRKYTYPEPTHGGWGNEESNWLNGWSHRKSHTINPASGAGTDYQVRIVVHFGPGIDSGENAYCDSKCGTDFGDIRFTDDDGVTELDYWMEEKVDGDYALFWVEVADDLSTTSAVIYVYYGNSGVITTSNGTNTFLFFDDFEGDDVNWDKWEKASGELSDSEVNVSGSILTIDGDGTDNEYLRSKAFITGRPVALRTKQRDYTASRYPCEFGFGYRYYQGTSDGVLKSISTADQFGLLNHAGTGESAEGRIADDDIYHRWDITWTSSKTQLLRDGTLQADLTTNIPSSSLYISLGHPETVAPHDWKGSFDWILVRKYVFPEPSHGAWGPQPTQDGQPDLTIIFVAAGIGAFTVIGIAAFLKARSPRPEAAVPEPRRPLPEPTYEEEVVPEEITPEREEVEPPESVLPSEVLCSYCGHVNPPGAKFCIRCGRQL